MIQSCVVLKEEFYFPVADAGYVQKESCRGKVGADNVLTLDLEGVITTFSVRKLGQSLWFYVTLEIPKETHVIWPAQPIIGKNKVESFDLTIEAFAKVISRGVNYKTAEFQVGTVMDNSSKEASESYFESILFSKKSIEKLEIKGLNIIVNGHKIPIPKIRFEKTNGMFLHPLNC